MNQESLLQAEAAARDFIAAVAAAREADRVKPMDLMMGNRHTSQIRRRSMDLIRALADMRRTN